MFFDAKELYQTWKLAVGAEFTSKQVEQLYDLMLRSMTKGERPQWSKARSTQERIELMSAYLDAGGYQKLWTQLKPLEQAMLSEVVHHTFVDIDYNRFKRKYGELPDFGVNREVSQKRTPRLLNCFIIHGLMPTQLQEALKAWVPEPSPAPPPAGSETLYPCVSKETGYDRGRFYERVVERKQTVHLREQAARFELRQVCELLALKPLPLNSSNGRVTGQGAALLLPRLQGGDFNDIDPQERNAPYVRAVAWPRLLSDAGLAQAAKTKLSLKPTPSFENLEALLQRVFDAALVSSFDELSRIQKVRVRVPSHELPVSPVKRRAMLFAALSRCPLMRWVGVDQFVDFLIADQPLIRDALPPRLVEFTGWSSHSDELVELKLYVRAVLLELAATLGLIDVSTISLADTQVQTYWGLEPLKSNYDGFVQFRLSPFGARCLGQAEPSSKQAELWKVLPNGEIKLFVERLPVDARESLAGCAVQCSAKVWRLQPERFLALAERGSKLEELREALRRGQGAELPLEIEKLFVDYAARRDSFCVDDEAYLVSCRSVELADKMWARAEVHSACARLDDARFAVPKNWLSEFERLLREEGYLLQKRLLE
ncbi:MAG: hypothetical protein RBU37_23200 [Myxococcota bacterium]|nr:hypothetical protein [Myxococcota bacterium]